VDYLPLTTITDKTTGKYVELGQLDTISSHGFAVYVFDDPGPRHTWRPEWKPVINVSGIDGEPQLSVSKSGCYVLTVKYRSGGLITEVWLESTTGKKICFDLMPEKGSKGGFTR